MQIQSRLAWISRVACAVALLSACESDDLVSQLPDGGAVLDAAGPDSSTCGAGSVWRELTVHHGETGDPLAGVQACVLDEPETCATTADDGIWSVCLPADADVALTFVKESFAPTIYTIRTSAGVDEKRRNTAIFLGLVEAQKPYWDQLGVEFPPTTQALLKISLLQYEPTNESFPSCLFDASASSDPVPEVGPAYFDAFGNYAPDQTATAATRCDVWFEFPTSADVKVRISHSTLTTCGQIDGGWVDPAADNTIVVPVRAGFRTRVLADCR